MRFARTEARKFLSFSSLDPTLVRPPISGTGLNPVNAELRKLDWYAAYQIVMSGRFVWSS
jgi:hypothetical protein